MTVVTTDGVILQKRSIGEATLSITLLTEEVGLLRASAKSARREKSKLRYNLESFTRGRFSLIQGKHEWKLIGGEGACREISYSQTSSRLAAGRVARLLTRLIQGEEYAPLLFQNVADGFSLFASVQKQGELESIECVLVLRILYLLGYLPRTPELAPFITDEKLSLLLAAEASARRSFLVQTINDSLLVTGL